MAIYAARFLTVLQVGAVIALADLVGRAGASSFQMAWACPHTPDEDDNHTCPHVTWSAHAQYHGARIQVAEHPTVTGAAMALAERLLRDATCRCRQPVTLSDNQPGCRWRLAGQRWEPGCDAPPLTVHGERGDHAAMRRAIAQPAEPANRRERRAAARKQRP